MVVSSATTEIISLFVLPSATEPGSQTKQNPALLNRKKTRTSQEGGEGKIIYEVPG